MTKQRKTATTSRKNEQELDLLSSLPDAILVEILSLLPTKLAVSTSVLSHRWQSLWTQVTSIDIHSLDFRQKPPDFYTIVDQFLSHFTSLCIHSFCLCVPEPQELSVDPLVGSWLHLICSRKVKKINVLANDSYISKGGGTLFTLPPRIFQTPSLSVLDLSHALNHKLPDDVVIEGGMTINLPNLKKLRLKVCTAQCGFDSKLMRSCPLIEQLYLLTTTSSGYGDALIDISCATLKKLHILAFRDTVTSIVIDAPKLSSFMLFASSLTCCFVNKPMNLREAQIFIANKALVLSLLPVISNVSLLRTLPFTLIGLNDIDNDAFIFRNLTDIILTLNYGCSLTRTLDGKISGIFDSPPARLLLHVKRIKLNIYDFKHRDHVLNLAKYMLSNGPVLVSLAIFRKSQSEGNVDEVNEEIEFYKELSGYLRSSSRCLIEFFGRYVNLPALKDRSVT